MAGSYRPASGPDISKIAEHGGFSPDRSADATAVKQGIDRAGAFLVITPEYNHGYPAPLKQLIDSHYRKWRAKPVAFVSYGGISGGLRAVEQLRQVFAELHVASIRDSVSFINAWEQFDADGNLPAPELARKSMRAMLTQLRWWATALHQARDAAPYGEVVA